MDKTERDKQARLEAASPHKRGDRVRATRDLLNMQRSAVDVDTDFQPRMKVGTLWEVVGYEASWPEPRYRLHLIDEAGRKTDWWVIAPGGFIEAAPFEADELDGLDRFIHRLFGPPK